MPKSYLIEGLDRLGKSTLIEGILNKEGFHQIIHYEKPKKLDFYQLEVFPLKQYQVASFDAMFRILASGAPMILDRAHLGECVYAPMYRKYHGEYVFELERRHSVQDMDARLILLTEDFSKSKHFVDDGLSLGTADKRESEQLLFIDAFNRSSFPDKKIICVTAEDGSFRPKEEILAEATA